MHDAGKLRQTCRVNRRILEKETKRLDDRDCWIAQTMETAERKVGVAEKLMKREEERLAELQKRKQEKGSDISTLEGVKHFLEKFNQEKCAILDSLNKIETLSKNERLDEFDRISQRLQSLQKFHSDSTMFLPSYDVRQSQETLANLHSRVQEKREILFPKKKFAFSSKKKYAKSEEKKTENNDIIEKPIDHDVQLSDCTVQEKSHDTIEMSEDMVLKKDVSLTDNHFSTIKIFGAPSTVHMKNLTHCVVIVGPVSSSVFITDCKHCTFVLACQQLRTHSTTESNFYLHVTSRAIIEDCSQLKFAPYSLTYLDLDKHFETAGLDKLKNNWNDVDDFNWLACDVHSPNWSILEENERQNFIF